MSIGQIQTVQAAISAGLSPQSTAKQVLGKRDLTDKVAIVTGGYSGIGLETVRALANAGATVIVPARTLDKARAAVRGIPNVELEVLDLMDPLSINTFAERFLSTGRPLHMLINSAGIMAAPLMRDARGYESQFATNHLGHFQLTAKLWPALKKANGARVVSVSSRAQRLGGVNFEDPNFENSDYDKWKAYAQSKSANVLFAVELDRLAKNSGVRAFSVHPGLIPTTGIGRFSVDDKTSAYMRAFNSMVIKFVNKFQLIKLVNLTRKVDKYKTIEQGAATSVWCATSDSLAGMGGVYCEDLNIAVTVPGDSTKGYGVRPWAIDPEYATKLWQLSEKLTGTKFDCL
ncbi:SDR family NAD(P)-dependent oxidoreductase [Paenibacillus sp. CGMCC 1.16610]|uniref:SDR family NAD(P)-dependent oxidoreductase n=1 Tax=Paenibacillus anseongense TaxID=2682845 RepID=A0ABW9UIX1_9BACL|nr:MULTISPECIES: SDR family NAD(P)-dependent oxidoreductase [Paenibacillus]MBA2941333.1 SDR family NAD(P)-dependent oxidoreductase [Paenibacillus sp. CGMCC 1.16610]MVQ40152.1 SDR family NAD(P)-dependent oxidoreductase [Paenibacillus anseongense]